MIAPPLGLYVHLPWCVRKCPYCDFNSHAAKGALPEAEYVAALLEDLAADAPLAAGRPVETVFFGGGTPSLFQPESIGAFLRGARERLPFAADAEITLEANPGTVEHGRFAGYREAGVNRISLGAQSFGARQLELLGRIHGAADTGRAVLELAAAGLGNFNLDLMHGLPEQSRAAATADVDQALALGPPHLSYYQLTLEPGTVFATRPPALPDEDELAAIQEAGHARLVAGGYAQYEVSAWARPGAECRHNLNYWRFGDYLGVGAGAHGKLTDAAHGEIVRTEKPKQPREYLARVAAGGAVGERRPVAARERPFEYFLNVLRLREGFRGEDFEARTGAPLAGVRAAIETALARRLLEPQPGGYRPTAFGLRFLNDLQGLFLEPRDTGPNRKSGDHGA
ncbi:MAG: radical SAM family heme chaperone HemW [Proteobacteria bacterium]|nr:radical SAM family heme chaperone HemW [Pseudomonadota bacterium]